MGRRKRAARTADAVEVAPQQWVATTRLRIPPRSWLAQDLQRGRNNSDPSSREESHESATTPLARPSLGGSGRRATGGRVQPPDRTASGRGGARSGGLLYVRLRGAAAPGAARRSRRACAGTDA